MSKSVDELAKWFDVAGTGFGSNVGEQVYPGQPGHVIADEAVRQMSWGFPLVLKSKKTGEPLKPKPVNNARTDKLDSFMWRSSFEDRRCIIPLTAWAEAEGPQGSKTRTWLSMPGQELFACAGIWRRSDEWGDVYSMVMTDASETVSEVHNRMPVLLVRQAYEQWLSGSPAEAKALCRPFGGDMLIERTDQPWTRARGK
jgi:putative SOS response-associated peptidase YedK